VGTVQQADARFLRRILFGMVTLTILTGAMAGFATVNAMAAEGVTLCQATGLLCAS
jgi:fluoride ion exporter CrcB/FEX